MVLSSALNSFRLRTVLLWLCSNTISHYCTDLHSTSFDPCNSSTHCPSQQGSSNVWIYYHDPVRHDLRLFTIQKLSHLNTFFFAFLSAVLEMAKCEFSASRWDWWPCAMQTSKRSTNVSLMLAHVPNASPQLQTMSQNKTGLISSIT